MVIYAKESLRLNNLYVFNIEMCNITNFSNVSEHAKLYRDIRKYEWSNRTVHSRRFVLFRARTADTCTVFMCIIFLYIHLLCVPVHAIVRTLSRVWCSVSIRVSGVGATDVLYRPAFIYFYSFFISISHPRICTVRILTSRDGPLTDPKIRTSSCALSDKRNEFRG